MDTPRSVRRVSLKNVEILKKNLSKFFLMDDAPPSFFDFNTLKSMETQFHDHVLHFELEMDTDEEKQQEGAESDTSRSEGDGGSDTAESSPENATSYSCPADAAWDACQKLADCVQGIESTLREARQEVLRAHLPRCIDVMVRLFDRRLQYPVSSEQVEQRYEQMESDGTLAYKTRPPSLVEYLDMVVLAQVDRVSRHEEAAAVSSADEFAEDLLSDLAAWVRDFPSHAPWLAAVLDRDARSVASQLGGTSMSLYGFEKMVREAAADAGHDTSGLASLSVVAGWTIPSAAGASHGQRTPPSALRTRRLGEEPRKRKRVAFSVV